MVSPNMVGGCVIPRQHVIHVHTAQMNVTHKELQICGLTILWPWPSLPEEVWSSGHDMTVTHTYAKGQG